MQVFGAGVTDTGLQRSENEDRFLVDPELGLYVVCDGMGGHASGALAAETAIATIRARFHQAADTLAQAAAGLVGIERVTRLAEQSVQEACARVHGMAAAREDSRGMGCTATLVVVAGRHAVMAHVGDSRLYVCRDGHVHRLSVDHTMARDLVARGVLAPEEVAGHPFAGSLTRAVGVQPNVQVDTLVFDLRGGDRLLICSDGLHAYIDSHAWLSGELVDEDLPGIAEELVAHANERGGHDNITALVIAAEDYNDDEATAEIDLELNLKVEALEQVALFQGLSLARLYHVLSAAQLVPVQAGEVVMVPGQEMAAMYIIARGSVRAAVQKGGSVRLGPGDHFGSTTLLRPRRARAHVEAVVDGTLLVLERARFQRMVRDRPYLGLLLYERIGRRICGEMDRANEALLDVRKSVLAVGPEASVTL